MSKKTILLGIAAAGLLAASASALERTAVLGSRGEIYIAKAGTYGSLFPTGTETTPANLVLAIEVTKASSSTQRFLVPLTKGEELESSPALIYEDDSDTLFVVWESRTTPLSSVLMLATFDGTHWTLPVQLSGNPFSSKSSPQLAITRDSFPVPGTEGATAMRNRTTLHMIWEEEGPPGNFEFLYTPVILEEGSYIGWNPVYHLGDFVADGESGSDFAPPLALVHSPVLQNGQDARTVVVAFASTPGRWLTSLIIDVLPDQLSRLSDGVRSSIIEIGRQGSFPGNRQVVAEKARSEVIARGTAFHTDVVQYMGNQIQSQILADQGTDLVALGEKVRSSIIEIGVRLSGRGLRDRGDTAKSRIAEIEEPQAQPEETSPAHLIHFRVADSRPVPQVGSNGVRLFVSENGEDMLIAWTEKDRVLYRMSKNAGWTDQREVRLSESVNLERAYEILAQRVRNY